MLIGEITIKISILNSDYSIEEFCLEKKYNEHSFCRFRIVVTEEEIDSTLLSIDRELSIIDDNESIIFNGFIYSVNIGVGNSGITEITAYSNSMKSDVVRYNRIYQNPKKKLSDIVELMNRDSGNNNLICEIKSGCDKEIEYPVIQDNETNYQFIVRLASECGLFVMDADSSTQKCIICDGTSENSASVSSDDIFTLNKIWVKDTVGCCSVNGIIINLEKSLAQGTTVTITGSDGNISKYVVYSINIKLRSAKYFYEYTLFEKSKLPLNVPSDCADRIFLEAEVTDNNDKDNYGRIQVRFIDEVFRDMDSDKGKQWIEWRTPYSAKSGGIVFLPEKQDIVEVIYSRKRFISGSALRKKANGKNTAFLPLEKDLSEADKNKYIAYLDKKRISFTDKEMELRYDENTVVMNDKKIVITVDKSIISVDSESISITVDGAGIIIKKSDIKINADNSIGVESKEVGVNGTNSLKLSSKKKVEVSASSEVAVSASKISLK